MLGIFTLIWEIPLFIISFIFYRINKAIITDMVKKAPRKKRSGPAWGTLSEMLGLPLALPYNMVTGPRWNCHAIIGLSGFFQVQEGIQIDIKQCYESARNWTLVIYDDSGATYCHVGAADCKKQQNELHQVDLKNGKYSIILRFYDCSENPVFPEILVDKNIRMSARPVKQEPENYQRFLNQIRGKKTAYYLFLHYYVFKMVDWEGPVPSKWVRKEFLPVGNPKTNFTYGPVKKQQPLKLSFDKQEHVDSDIYISIYNRCSFPVHWEKVEKEVFEYSSPESNGYYLVRKNKK